MNKEDVNSKDKLHVNKLQGSWNEALTDAEHHLSEAHKDVLQWKAVVSVCREKIAKGEPWPGTKSDSATQD
jgi:hypothetical protein